MTKSGPSCLATFRAGKDIGPSCLRNIRFSWSLLTQDSRFTPTMTPTHPGWTRSQFIKDGYAWWPVRIHPSDAEKRGIQNNDTVRLYNDRGSVLCVAVITERVKPGVIHSYASSAKYDPLEPGKPDSTDRGGCVNLLTSGRMLSKNAPGMTPNSCLIEIEKWED